MNRRLGRWSQLLAPGYSFCRRCKTPWRFVKWHDTSYGRGHGCLPLCQMCWSELTPEQRLPYYLELIASWHERYPHDAGPTFDEEWAQVRDAVLRGG